MIQEIIHRWYRIFLTFWIIRFLLLWHWHHVLIRPSLTHIRIHWKNASERSSVGNIARFYWLSNDLGHNRSICGSFFWSCNADSVGILRFRCSHIHLRWSSRLWHVFVSSKRSTLYRFFYLFHLLCLLVRKYIFLFVLTANRAAPDVFFDLNHMLFELKPIRPCPLILAQHKLHQVGQFWRISLLEQVYIVLQGFPMDSRILVAIAFILIGK
jgi:hypothetical protein